MTKDKDPKGKDVTDDEIVELYFKRNEEAIRLTEERYGRLIFKVAYNILGDRQYAEQCENDTYLGIWNAVPPERPTRFAAFAVRIARCAAISKYREEKGKSRIPSELTVSMEELYGALGGEEVIASKTENEELKRLINEYVRGLGEKRRYIFVGRYYMAESVEEIARALGITESAVYKELTKIKRGLKKHLEENEVNI